MKTFLITMSENELKLFSEFLEEQKEFGARERKMRRKLDRAAQNAEMHANRAKNKVEAAKEAIRSGRISKAEALNKTAQKSIGSASHDLLALENQSSKMGGKANDLVNNLTSKVSSTQTATEAVNKTVGKVVKRNKKALAIGGALAATGVALGAGMAIKRRKNSSDKQQVQ